MNLESLQSISHIAILVGLILAALGGYGSYYFGKKMSFQKDNEFTSSMATLKEGNESLQRSLKPFEDIAAKLHPSLEREQALLNLQEDIEQLQEIAAKYEYRPIPESLRKHALDELHPVAQHFLKQQISIEVTYETWASPQTRKFAEELTDLLGNAGFTIDGTKFATVYLVGDAYACEWGYNKEQEAERAMLVEVLTTILRKGDRHVKRSTLEKGKMRIHLGGQVQFNPDGTVSIE